MQSFLLKNQIHTAIHYPVPIHLQPAYRGRLKTSKSMRITEAAAESVLSLPMYPQLQAQQLTTVVRLMREFLGRK